MTIYLYVKTHQKTGLKYLGKTTRDPFNYLGSGVDWRAHLKEHGIEHTTEIVKECQSNQELNEWGRYYSNLWNVVESNEWANRIPETGGGICSAESAIKISNTLKGRKKAPRTALHRENLSKATKGKPRPRSENHQLAWNESARNKWENNLERKKQISNLGKSTKGRKESKETREKKRQSMLNYWKLKKAQES